MNFWLFRTDLKTLEDYHQYTDLENFEKNLWDFYLSQSLQLLRSTNFEEVVIWRLSDKKRNDIIFNIGKNKKFIQRWVKSLDEVFDYQRPDVSFFRGGFKIYCDITKSDPKFFGLKLYLGANGPRRYPVYGGKYDKILIEDERDIKKNTIPFYKIGVPNIFKPLDLEKKYDIIFPANGTQLKYKGLDFFVKNISKSKILKSLKIICCGNRPEIGKKICEKYKINNIEFVNKVNRNEFNKLINQSKFGIVCSNELDGCVRVSTEVLATGTPLLIRDKARLLNYYKLDCTRIFSHENIEKVYIKSNNKYEELRQKNLKYLKNEFNFDNICQMNFNLWSR